MDERNMDKVMLGAKKIFICALGLMTTLLYAQYPGNSLPQYPETWTAQWITHPDIDKTAYGLVHFRKEIELNKVPQQFIVHISGDNRYRLYVNGEEVAYGPQLGDLQHWRYETLNLAPFLKSGKNLIAAEVMNWGVERAHGIISHKTGFWMQGHSKAEQVLDTTTENDWKVEQNNGIHEKTVYWRQGDILGGFYASNPTDSIVAKDYTWGWNTAEINTTDWKDPEEIFWKARTKGIGGHGWILQPRTTKIQTSNKESIGKIVRTNVQSIAKNSEFGQKPMTVPANTKASFLIDKGLVTLGYPKMNLSGGAEAEVRIKYSEALYNDKDEKGNRNEIEGKRVEGITDVYIMDGAENRVFQPIWFRTFRFIQLDVTTKDEPLTINDYHNIYSASDFPVVANFNTDNKLYKDVWDICWHSMKICAQDNLMSDAYYEQMQYVGDLRPHLMGWYSLTGDLSYYYSAMDQFNNSRLPDGNITSCYPLKSTFVHPTYSLMWIDMLHDLMMLSGNKEFIGRYTGEIQEVFDYYESLINENGLVGKSKYKMFIDWYVPKGGNSVANVDGNSAILTLNYAYTLDKAADLLTWLGRSETAELYLAQSRKYAEIVRKMCYDAGKGLYADDPEKTFFDQRASILAVLTDAHSEAEKKAMMKKLLDPATNFDSYANLFYYFYLYDAMQRTGVGNFTEQLQPWKDIVAMGMTATPEKRIEQHPRSEVHPWTAHPVHFYFSLVAGIRPSSPGFETVSISPMPGELPKVDVSYPTVKGKITMKVDFPKNGKPSGTIVLPEGMTGEFVWKGKKYELAQGENVL
jgi:hypothetical protein